MRKADPGHQPAGDRRENVEWNLEAAFHDQVLFGIKGFWP